MGSIVRGMAVGCGGMLGLIFALVTLGAIAAALRGQSPAVASFASPSPVAKAGPATPTSAPAALAHGANITPPQGGIGHGELTLKNGNDRDAAVKLVEDTPQKRVIRFVYVQAKRDLVLRGIAEGTYRVLFMTGVDWDAANRTFRREARALRFEDPLPFEVTSTARGKEHTTWELTLNAVPGGTVNMLRVSAEEFAR